MWEDVREMLIALGHDMNNIVELKALSAEQMMDGTKATATGKDAMDIDRSSIGVAHASEVDARTHAVGAISKDKEALLKKAALAGEISSGTTRYAGAGTKRSSWSNDNWSNGWKPSGWWSSSGWDGPEANSWKSGKWSCSSTFVK